MGGYNNYNNEAIRAFIEGRAKKVRAVISTGDKLTYHGNLIAEWKKDGLYISNGNYTTYTRAGAEVTGSKTTKGYLNQLPRVSINQSQCKWYLNGNEWDGQFINIEGTSAPKIEANNGNYFDESTTYKATDGWRGYTEPLYAVVGANDTGMYSDSPCPSNVREAELKAIKEHLQKEGIKTKQIVTESSNVFCVHVYLIAKVKDVERARNIVEAYLENNETRLSYLVKNQPVEA
jgi:hypothetical protein